MARREQETLNEVTLADGSDSTKTIVIKPAAVATEVAADSTHTLAIEIGGSTYRIMLTNA